MHEVMLTKMIAGDNPPVNCACHSGGIPQQSDIMLRYFLISFYDILTLNGPQISMAGKVIFIVYCRMT